MTIKTRNRLNLSLFTFSLFFILLNIIILGVSLHQKTFSLEIFLNRDTTGNFLTKYNPYCVLFSIYFQIFYVCITSFMLYRVFEKTQTSDIVYIFLFLIACIANSFRLWIPLFNLTNTYSRLLLFCGNAVIFSKLLFPFSLFCSVVMTSAEQRQDLEKNIFILLLVSIFFSQLIPLNTVNSCNNFEIEYGYRGMIKTSEVLVILATLFAQFINNQRKLYTQLTTIGLACITIGITCLFNTTTILRFIVSFAFLLCGNILYLKELHKQYLWND